MRRIAILLIFLAGGAAAKDKFHPPCTLPFPGPSRHIDKVCGPVGLVEETTSARQRAHEAQNAIKNNLCSDGEAALLTNADFMDLQHAVDALPGFHFGNAHAGGFGPPLDRTPLTTLPQTGSGEDVGEGSVVSYVGFLVDAQFSPPNASGTGETVNCGLSDHEDVDIHLALAETPLQLTKGESTNEKNAKLCQTVTAEVIPHHRPANWQPDILQSLSDRPMKITGQLFFDGSHRPRPCPALPPAHGDPARASVWEIHPVYQIQICKRNVTTCRADHASDWESVTAAVKALNALLEEE